MQALVLSILAISASDSAKAETSREPQVAKGAEVNFVAEVDRAAAANVA